MLGVLMGILECSGLFDGRVIYGIVVLLYRKFFIRGEKDVIDGFLFRCFFCEIEFLAFCVKL